MAPQEDGRGHIDDGAQLFALYVGQQQAQHDEGQHDQAIKDALHQDSDGGPGDGHGVIAAQQIDAQGFTGAQRVDVVAHVADADDAGQGTERHGAQRAQQKAPAPGNRQQRGDEEQRAQQQPAHLNSAQAAQHVFRVQVAEGQIKEEQAHGEAEEHDQALFPCHTAPIHEALAER